MNIHTIEKKTPFSVWNDAAEKAGQNYLHLLRFFSNKVAAHIGYVCRMRDQNITNNVIILLNKDQNSTKNREKALNAVHEKYRELHISALSFDFSFDRYIIYFSIICIQEIFAGKKFA